MLYVYKNTEQVIANFGAWICCQQAAAYEQVL